MKAAEIIASAPSGAPTEQVTIKRTGLAVEIRAIETMAEFEEIQSEIERATKLRDRGMLGYQDLTQGEINSAAWLRAGLVLDEPISFPEALAVTRAIGPQAVLIATRIAEISGLAPDSQARAQEALAKNPFPAGVDDDLPRVPAPAAE